MKIGKANAMKKHILKRDERIFKEELVGIKLVPGNSNWW